MQNIFGYLEQLLYRFMFYYTDNKYNPCIYYIFENTGWGLRSTLFEIFDILRKMKQ